MRQQIQLPLDLKYPPEFRVVMHQGRFKVVRKVAQVDNTYSVIEDCRTHAFAQQVCEAYNEGRLKAS